MIDLFSVSIEHAVVLVLRLGWSDARSRKKMCRFVLVSSEVRCLFLILLAGSNGNEALSCQNVPFRVYLDSCKYVLRWRSTLHMLLTLHKVFQGMPVFTQVHLMFTQGREEEGKQRIKMRFYKSLKSRRPFQVQALSSCKKAKTTVASLFIGSSGKPSRFCEAFEM